MKVPFKKEKDVQNIFDYLYWRGDLTLESDPLNEVDALILARLAYLPFEQIRLQEATAPVTVANALSDLLALPGIGEAVLYREDLNLMRALLKSRRFQNLLLSHYVNQIDLKTKSNLLRSPCP